MKSMKLIERQRCPYCEGFNFSSLFKKNYSSNILQEFLLSYYKNKKILDILKFNLYEIVECSECTGLFQKFIPDDNLSYYLYEKLISANDSFNKKNNITHTNFREYNFDAEIIKKLFKKDNNQIKILEFGCGWGFWAKFMKELNFDVETIEISETRIHYLKKNKIQNYNNINELVKNYDLIFSNQALEHVSSPFHIIQNLYNKLNKDGIMYHKFPSSFLFKKKLSRNYEPKKDCAHPLEHINIFNKKCFEKMVKKIKLKEKNVENLSFVSKIKFIKNKFLFNQIILEK
ncbi:BioC, biotin biosynthesis protein BioC [Candidatus Pelagibacterales bacterium]